jgi:riboflavin kinase/FMN adenylyltransferase
VVLTFEPHPLTIVAPDRAPMRLTAANEKLDLLVSAGVGVTVVAKSEPVLLQLSAKQFVQDVVLARFRPLHIVEGPTFGFGRGRAGTPQLLADLCRPHGCEVHIVDPVRVSLEGESVMVSSSLIRRYLDAGAVDKAAVCLGRPFAVSGKIVEGAKRGQTIGFPTINVEPGDVQIPGAGVYAGVAELQYKRWAAAINVGPAPTFGAVEHRIEAHLLDFSSDVYGEMARIEFHKRLRGQQKFASPEALAEQLSRDVSAVRECIDLTGTATCVDICTEQKS